MTIEITSFIHFLASFLGLLSVVLLWAYTKNNFESYKLLGLVSISLSIGVGLGFLVEDRELFFPVPVWVVIQMIAVIVLIALVFFAFKKKVRSENEGSEIYQETETGKKRDPQAKNKTDHGNSDSAYDMDPEVTTQILIELEILMIDDFPYLNQGYTLSDLASDTGFPYYQVSTVINQKFGMNFNDYINQQRIEFCKQNMESDEWAHLTLEAIAFECGFSNRNSFTIAFKKFTGVTPSKYFKSTKPM